MLCSSPPDKADELTLHRRQALHELLQEHLLLQTLLLAVLESTAALALHWLTLLLSPAITVTDSAIAILHPTYRSSCTSGSRGCGSVSTPVVTTRGPHRTLRLVPRIGDGSPTVRGSDGDGDDGCRSGETTGAGMPRWDGLHPTGGFHGDRPHSTVG